MPKTARANWTLADAEYRRSKVARPINQGSIKAMIEGLAPGGPKPIK
jgi:hypothetical protein